MALTTIRDLIDALRAGRSSIAPIVTANKAIRDDFVAERDVLTGERDTLVGERDTIVSAQQALQAELQTILDDRDTLVTARDGINGELQTLRGELSTLRGERSVLQSEKAALESEASALAQQRTAIENDGGLTDQERIDALAAKDIEISAKAAEISAKDGVIATKQSAVDAKAAERDVKLGELSAKQAEIDIKDTERDAKRGEIVAKVAEREAKVDEITAKRSEIAAKKTELSIAQGDLKEAQAYRRTVSDMLQSLRDAGGLDPADTATEVQDAYDAVTAMMAAEGLWDAGDFQSYTVLILQKRGELPLGTVTDASLQALLEDTAKTVTHAEDSVKEWCCDQLAHVYDVHLEERPSEVAMKAAIAELESGDTTFTEFGTAIAAIRSGQGKIR